MLTFLNTTLALFLFSLVWIASKFFLQPYRRIKELTKHGITYYTPGGSFFDALESKSRLEKRDSLYFLKQEKLYQSNHKLISGNVLHRVFILLKDPELIKQLLSHPENYVKWERVVSLLKDASRSGLVFSEGDVWKKHRKLVSQAFHFEFVKDLVPTIA